MIDGSVSPRAASAASAGTILPPSKRCAWRRRDRVRLAIASTGLSAILSLFVAAIAATAAASEEPPSDLRVYETRRIESEPPVLDGRLDDPVWETVEWAGDFLQREPSAGDPPHQQTAFKILYDDESLYFGFRAYDSEPHLIERQSGRRDYFPGDWVEINIDSHFDKRTAYSFTTSASGVKGDEFVSADGDSWDGNWDPIWFVKTMIDDEGWCGEVEIPLSQLRFSGLPEQVWGVQVTRRIFRMEERSNWQFIPMDAPGWVSGFGELRGLRNLSPPRQIEILPYAVTRAESFAKEAGNPFATGSDEALAFGLDGKLGLSSDLTLDLTVNPDFGQVEADPSEVNLSAFESFFSEKRPFFIEGSNILDFPLAPAVTGGNFTQDNLFYSRRIGRAPQGSADTGPGEYSDTPDNSSILGAMKITGKSHTGLSLGILNAVTAEEKAEIAAENGRRKQTVEPTSNFFAGRAQQDWNGGETMLGAMLTAVNRDITEREVEFLHSAAYAGGLDFRRFFSGRTFYVEGSLEGSHVRGDEAALLRTQTSSARYYQRPDASHTDLDSMRTSLSGHAGSVRVGKGSRGNTRFQSGVAWRSPGFEVNDLGFMRRADEINHFTWVNYRIEKPFSIFRRLAFNGNQWANFDFGGHNLSNALNTNFNANFKNNYSCGAGVTREFEYTSNTAMRGGPSSLWPGGWSPEIWVNSDSRQKISYGFGGNWYIGDEDHYWNRGEWVDLTIRPTNEIRVTMSPNHSRTRAEYQYVTRRGIDGTDRFVFADLEQETVSLTFRLDYAATPNLSIQYYGSPFISAGEYSHFKRAASPRADRLGDRFHAYSAEEIQTEEDGSYTIEEAGSGLSAYGFGNPDFNYREFNSNLVVRWEFSAGSLVYLVWSQGREDFVGQGNFSARHDVDELFDVHPHDIFLIKVSRWFSL